mmetsp:Transcript_9972/g.41860  ORF Transcript_9972/g.41860 Transcript_9972/m.41860 type:complete len:245 (-) Transcript_9972:204-938(-)
MARLCAHDRPRRSCFSHPETDLVERLEKLGREKLARPPVLVEPTRVQGARGSSRGCAEERDDRRVSRLVGARRVVPRQTQMLPGSVARVIRFFAGEDQRLGQKPPASGEHAERFVLDGSRLGILRREVGVVVKQSAHLFVVVEQRVVAHAEHVHVGGLARVRRGEGKAEVSGGEVVARAIGAAKPRVDVPRTCCLVRISHDAGGGVHVPVPVPVPGRAPGRKRDVPSRRRIGEALQPTRKSRLS